MGPKGMVEGRRVCWRGLIACQRGLRAYQRSSRACQRGLRACQRGLRAYQRGLRACQEARWGDVRTDGQNFFPFYRTLSPVGAAAQKGKLKQIRVSWWYFWSLWGSEGVIKG